MIGTKPVHLLGTYHAGQRQISASDLNTLIASVKAIMQMTVQPPLQLHVGPNQLSLSLMSVATESFVGQIVSQGPEGEDDYTDNRYWVKRCSCALQTGDANSLVEFTPLPVDHLDAEYITATNITEAGTRAALLDAYVLVYAVYDAQSPPVKRYYFVGPNNPLQLCRITGATAIAAANNGPENSTTEWTYTVEAVTLDVSSGDLTVTTDESITIEAAFNGMEIGNRNVGTGGTFGNGVKYDDIDSEDFTGRLQPITTSRPIEMVLFMASDDKAYAMFSSPNGITGKCVEEES